MPIRKQKQERNLIRCLAALAILFCAGGGVAAEINSTRWEKDIAAFEAEDRTNPPPKGGVLFIGSSSIRLWPNIAGDFPDLQVIQRGFGGSHIPDATHFADRIVIPYAPAKIVLYAGDNDIAGGRSPEQVFSDFRDFAAKVRSSLPKTKIYFVAIKPSPSRWHLSPQAEKANSLIRKYCRVRPELEYIDIWKPMLTEGQPDPGLFEKDQLHMNAKGYAIWTKAVQKALKN